MGEGYTIPLIQIDQRILTFPLKSGFEFHRFLKEHQI